MNRGMTIGALAREFGLSRGTLLHYDAIGLLRPTVRRDSRYRVYTEADMERLRQICLYRSAGMPLAEIQSLLDSREPEGFSVVLRRRLAQISREMAALNQQQRLIVRLLASQDDDGKTTMLNKEQFVALMRSCGMTDEDMRRWHQEFEKMSGESHAEFLAFLGIPAGEIEKIREWSKQ